MLVILRGVVCAFVTVTTVAALVEFAGWFGNTIVFGVKFTGAMPTPDTAMVCGEFEALSVTVMVDDEDCTAVGVYVSERVHVLSAASVAPQLFVCANGAVA